MRILVALLTLSVFSGSVLASETPSPKLVLGADGSALTGPSEETASRTVEDGGTGPYKALMVSDKTLPTHTVFRPKQLSALGERVELPIVA
jgi:hypothetical protein